MPLRPTSASSLSATTSRNLWARQEVLQKIIPDMRIDARLVSPEVQDSSKSHLAGELIILEHKTKALSADFF